MIINLSSYTGNSELNSDICIVGAGAAGIALGFSLLDSHHSVIILESGDISEEEDAPFLRGSNVGEHPFSIGGQRRRIGGGMNDWSGNCSQLELEDFNPLEKFPSNWPIAFSELAKYSDKVENFLKLDKRFSRGALTATSEASTIGFQKDKSISFLKEKLFIRSKIKIPKDQLDSLIDADERFRIITGASVGQLNISENQNHTDSITAICGEKTITVKSKIVVLASGLENAPILLRTLGQPSENEQHPLPALGHFLHSHLLTLRGFFVSNKRASKFREYCLPADLGVKGKEKSKSFRGLQIAPTVRRERNILNGTMFLSPVTKEALLIPEEVHSEAKELLSEENYSNNQRIYAVRHFIEQIPRKHNHITLGNPWGKSPFQRPQFHWSLDEEEEKTIGYNLEILGEFMETQGLGKVYDRSCGEEENSAILSTNAHPMGGTIMGVDRKSSVVDQNCRVHGFDNLYVLGGSVVPRSGACMITGVILQLSFRLADHIKAELN